MILVSSVSRSHATVAAVLAACEATQVLLESSFWQESFAWVACQPEKELRMISSGIPNAPGTCAVAHYPLLGYYLYCYVKIKI